MEGISRRTFLKGAGATAALASLGGVLALPKVEAFAAGSTAAPEKTTVRGYCRMCMLCGACFYEATLENGVVTNIEGDYERKTNKGTLCPRGKGAIMNLYNPYRIKAPMKRTNPEKGMDIDPGWVEITWEEALNTAAQKLKEVHDRDPRELVNFYGFAAYESSHSTLGMGLWPKVFGTPNVSSTKGQFCAIHYGGMYEMTAVPTVNYDAAHCNYIVSVGKSLGFDSGMANGDGRGFANGLRRGMHNVVVGPRCNMEASHGEWIPSRPGSDLSFIYALAHTILYELNKFDKKFVEKRTNAPYLIDSQGEYVRGASGKPQIWDLSSGKSKDFDDPTLAQPALEGSYSVGGKDCVPGFSLFKEHLKDFTADWASSITTIPAATIRRIAAELVENASIGSTITIDGKVLPLRPAAVLVGRASMNQEDGTLLDIFSRVLNMLLGNIGAPGGLISTMSNNYAVNPDGTTEPYLEAATCNKFTWPPQSLDLAEFFPHRHTTNTLMLRVMQDPQKWGLNYKPTLLVSSAANPIMTNSEPEVAIAALKKIDYAIYHACYHMDEMALMSDLLLPEHAVLEQTAVFLNPGNECSATTGEDDFTSGHRALLYRKGITPLYNTMNGNDMIIEMFYRARLLPMLNGAVNKMGCVGFPGMSPKFANPAIQLNLMKKYTILEMWDLNLKSQLGPDKGLKFLEKHQIVPFLSWSKSEVYTAYRKPNDNARFQLYLMSQKHSGDFLIPAIQKSGVDLEKHIGIPLDELRRRFTALPYYPKSRKIYEAPKDYDLFSFHYRQPMFMFRMASMDQNPITRDYASKFMPDYNTILINSETAKVKGIAQGDNVVVESPYGKTKGKAYVTETVHPETIGIGGAKGRKSKFMGKDLVNDTNYNDLLTGDFGHVDLLHGGIVCTAPVKVYKA